jgi:dienelactone hydrolase
LSQENKDGVPSITAACAAHPGRFSIPQDVTGAVVPLQFIFAEKDFEIKEKQLEQVRELAKSMKDCPVHYYPGTTHGFAVRGDETNPDVKAARQDAFKKACEFFKKYM